MLLQGSCRVHLAMVSEDQQQGILVRSAWYRERGQPVHQLRGSGLSIRMCPSVLSAGGRCMVAHALPIHQC